MAKKRFRIKDKQGNTVDYDISSASVTIDVEGKSLDVKLSELANAIAAAVTRVVYNDVPHNVSNGAIDIGSQMQADWNESSQQYPAYIKNKPNVVTGIKVGESGSVRTPSNGVVTIPEGGSTIVPDNEMSATSDNVVKNKVIKAYVDNLINGLINGAPAALDTLKELADALGNNDDAIAALTNLISTKANDNAVVKSISVNGTAQSKDANGNVNVVVPTVVLDDAPTAGSDNGVKSGGVKTALDNLLQNLTIGQNGNWYVGQTDTGVKAQGPTGNCTITDASEMVSEIVNDLDTGGASKFLSAEMGKKLKNAIVTIYNALSEYAFAGGKPTIDLSATIAVSFSVGTHITHTDVDSVSMGGQLVVSLGTDDDLYDIDDSTVEVTMNGADVTETVYDATLNKITINGVTGDVVITVGNAVTYIDVDGTDNKLAFFLDCKNRGNQAGHWIDLIGGVDFALTNVTEADTGMVFNGSTSKGEVASGGLNVPYDSATIEAVIDVTDLTIAPSQRYPILANTVAGAAAATMRTNDKNVLFLPCATNGNNVAEPQNMAFFFNLANRSFGSTRDTVVIDGVEPEYPRIQPGQGGSDIHDYGAGLSSKYAVGYMNFSGTDYYFSGKILAIRVYKAKLTAAQILHNHNIDKKRYNLQ